MQDSGREKVEHFTNVEGADKRAKAAAKKREKLVGNYVKNTDTKKPKCSCKVFAIFLAVIFLIIAGVLAFLIFRPGKNEPQLSNEEYAKQLLDEALEKSGYLQAESDYTVGLQVYNAAKESTSDSERLAYIELSEADFLGNYYGKFKRARELMNHTEISENQKITLSCYYQEINYGIALQENDLAAIEEFKNGACNATE